MTGTNNVAGLNKIMWSFKMTNIFFKKTKHVTASRSRFGPPVRNISFVLPMIIWGQYCFIPGHYIYMESSIPRQFGHTSRLVSPVYPRSKSRRCFQLWYHMLGPEEPECKYLNVVKLARSNTFFLCQNFIEKKILRWKMQKNE